MERQLSRLSSNDLKFSDPSHLKTKETQITGYPILNMRVMSIDQSGSNLITMCSEYANQLITYDIEMEEIIEERELKERPQCIVSANNARYVGGGSGIEVIIQE